MWDSLVFTPVEYRQVIETDPILTLDRPPYRAFPVVWLLAGIMLCHNHIIHVPPMKKFFEAVCVYLIIELEAQSWSIHSPTYFQDPQDRPGLPEHSGMDSS